MQLKNSGFIHARCVLHLAKKCQYLAWRAQKNEIRITPTKPASDNIYK